MGKRGRLLLKIFLTVLGMLIIGYILSVSIRIYRMQQPEGTFVRLQDALILVEALDENYRQDERYIGLEQELEAAGDSYLTFQQFGRLMEMLEEGSTGMVSTGSAEAGGDESGEAQEKVNVEAREELKRQREGYKKKYRDEFYVLLEDWYSLYDGYVDMWDMEDGIQPVNITVLGTGSQVSDGEGQPLSEGSLLAEEGIYLYRSDLFESCKYQVIQAYKKDEILLTVRKTVSRGMNLANIWIMEADAGRLQAFYKGYEIWFPYEKAEASQREQIGDFDFADGILQVVKIKGEKINGKLLSVREGQLEIEGLGTYPIAGDMRVYRLYESLSECEVKDLRIGYDFTDFVLEDGVVCAGLITRDEAMENIRVVIKGTDFAGAYHERVELMADTDFMLHYGTYEDRKSKGFAAGDVVSIDGDSEYFTGERIAIEPVALTGRTTLLSVKRAQGNPAYRGRLEIARTEEGLVVVNELLLEEYLYSVVPSEMPASYPLEALKAQAICARTYAYRHMQRSGIAQFGAHVDDSAGYQVYNNIAENANTTKAVRETSGRLLYYGEELCGSYYYSTSCGFGTDTDIWKSESREDTSYLQARRIGTEEEGNHGESAMDEEKFASFITQKFPSDYESSEPWYRWSYQAGALDGEKVLETLKKRYEANTKLILTENKDGEFESMPVERLGEIRDIYIVKRGPGGVADELIVEGTRNTFKVISEHNIRYVLNDGESKVTRQDGSQVASNSLLPSAYFIIELERDEDIVTGYRLTGGGYGHGVGMSQNGARQMAGKGFTSDDILLFFYQACEVKNIY